MENNELKEKLILIQKNKKNYTMFTNEEIKTIQEGLKQEEEIQELARNVLDTGLNEIRYEFFEKLNYNARASDAYEPIKQACKLNDEILANWNPKYTDVENIEMKKYFGEIFKKNVLQEFEKMLDEYINNQN